MPTAALKTLSAYFSVVLVVSSLTGCAISPMPMAESERLNYDGWWTAKIKKTPSPQTQNSWRMQCTNLEGEFAFEVVDGMVRMNILGASQESELSKGGQFKVKQVTGRRVSESAGSDVTIDDGTVTYVIKGVLGSSKPKGSIQNWVQGIGAGCITKIVYEREQG